MVSLAQEVNVRALSGLSPEARAVFVRLLLHLPSDPWSHSAETAASTFTAFARASPKTRQPNGTPIVIDGRIAFGNDKTAGAQSTLFLAAGINDEADGLFGSLRRAGDKEG